MAMSISNVTAANDGTVTLSVIGQVPKSEEEDFVEVRVIMKVAAAANRVTLKPIGTEYPKRS